MEEAKTTSTETDGKSWSMELIHQSFDYRNSIGNSAFCGGRFYYTMGEKVMTIDTPANAEITVWREFGSQIRFFAFSKDKKRYFISFFNGTQYVCCAETHSQIKLHRHDKAVLYMIEYGKDEVISVSSDEIRRYNQFTGELVLAYSVGYFNYTSICSPPVFDESCDKLFISGYHSVSIFCNKTGKNIGEEMKEKLGEKNYQIACSSMTKFDKDTLFIIGQYGIFLLDTSTYTIKARYPWEKGKGYNAKMLPDGRHVMFGVGVYTHLCIFDTKTQKIVSTIMTNVEGITDFTISDDGSQICVTGLDGTRGRGRVSVVQVTPSIKQ